MRITKVSLAVCIECTTQYLLEYCSVANVKCPECLGDLVDFAKLHQELGKAVFNLNQLHSDFCKFKGSLNDSVYNQQHAIDQAREIDKDLVEEDAIPDYIDFEAEGT